MDVLRAEIRRLARKETKHEVARLKKQVTVMRRRVAEAKTRLIFLERATKRANAAGPLAAAVRGAAMEHGETGDVQIRFSPAWVSSHRKKLRMSRLLYARLVGVSPQTIMGWERGRSRPRRKALETWRAVREMGKRELKSRLAREDGAESGRPARRRKRVARKVVRRRTVRKVVARRKVGRAVRRVSRVRARTVRARTARTRAVRVAGTRARAKKK
jgi:DNA-binding transcriptional regulator YiaG